MSLIKFNNECVHVIFLGLPNVPGIAAGIFQELSINNIDVGMVTQNSMRGGRSDLSFLIHADKLDEIIILCRELSSKFGGQGVSFATEIAAITVEIKSPSESAQTLAKIFSALADVNINIEIINSSSEAVIFIISSTRAQEGLKALEKVFNSY